MDTVSMLHTIAVGPNRSDDGRARMLCMEGSADLLARFGGKTINLPVVEIHAFKRFKGAVDGTALASRGLS
jgi:hypothetical protein